jgi:glutamine synthetase
MTVTARVPLPHGVLTVDLVVPDLVGSLRGKKVPAARWDHVSEHGVAIANAIFVWTARCILERPVQYANMATGFPDVEIVPDLATLRALPWRPGNAMVICDTKEADGSPCVMAPRQVLRSVIDRATAMGYAPSVGFEVEFYLLDPETLLSRDSGIQCYSPLRGNEYEHVIAPIRNHLTDIGMVVEASNSEYGPGQFEINIRYDDALTTADNAVLFRHAVRDIAAQHGLLATFMAKPFGLESGCGMHIHQSLWKDGVNVFADGGKLSEIGRWYLGGLEANMRSMALLGSPTPNAMRRRQPYTFCPVTDAWGVDNRTVGLRVIHGPDEAVRIEQRDGASDCNPYLVIAAQLAAGLGGIEARREPRHRSDGDEYADRVGDDLPTSIPDAVKLLRESELVGNTFDPLLIEAVVTIAEFEYDTVTSLPDHQADDVSPGERAWYAPAV